MSGRERPSRHGAILGRAVADLAEAGRAVIPELPDGCATCAFRPGCMTNQMAATLMEALKCVLGLDDAIFACHHGLKEGEPSRVCAGYLAAQEAPWAVTQEVVSRLNDELAAMSGADDIRAAFDAWIAEVDPGDALDDYQRGRLYLKAFPQPKQGALAASVAQ